MGQAEPSLQAVFALLEPIRTQRPSGQMGAGRSNKGAKKIASILKAAHNVFAVHGDRLSFRQVATEADVAPGNISYYFGSRQELIEAMIKETFANNADGYFQLLEEGDPGELEFLLRIIDYSIKDCIETHKFYFHMWSYVSNDARVKETVSRLFPSLSLFLSGLVRRANPTLTEDQMRQVLMYIYNLTQGVRVYSGMTVYDENVFEQARKDARFMIERLVTNP